MIKLLEDDLKLDPNLNFITSQTYQTYCEHFKKQFDLSCDMNNTGIFHSAFKLKKPNLRFVPGEIPREKLKKNIAIKNLFHQKSEIEPFCGLLNGFKLTVVLSILNYCYRFYEKLKQRVDPKYIPRPDVTLQALILEKQEQQAAVKTIRFLKQHKTTKFGSSHFADYATVLGGKIGEKGMVYLKTRYLGHRVRNSERDTRLNSPFGRRYIKAFSPDCAYSKAAILDAHKCGQNAHRCNNDFSSKIFVYRSIDLFTFIEHFCPRCCQIKRYSYSPPQGSLPLLRVNPTSPRDPPESLSTFLHVQLDFYGPILTYPLHERQLDLKSCTRAQRASPFLKAQKCFVLITACLQTRAISLEIVEKLDISGTLCALVRHSTLYGQPLTAWSDLGSSFLHLKKQSERLNLDIDDLEDEFKSMEHGVSSWCRNLNILHQTNSSAHHPQSSGLAEELIGEVKDILDNIIGRYHTKLTVLETSTVLRRCQNLYHSLPITPDPRAPHRAISRNDLLHGPGRPEYVHYVVPDGKKSKISQRWELMLKVQALFTSILHEKYCLLYTSPSPRDS